MKYLIYTFLVFSLVGCSVIKDQKEKRKREKLVVLPFGEHDLLMAMKDSAYVNDCLMNDLDYYLKHIKNKGYDGAIPPEPRQITKFGPIAKRSQNPKKKSKTNLLLCVDSEGKTRFSKFISTESDDKTFVRNLHHNSLQMEFEPRTLSNCIECYIFTMTIYKSTVRFMN